MDAERKKRGRPSSRANTITTQQQSFPESINPFTQQQQQPPYDINYNEKKSNSRNNNSRRGPKHVKVLTGDSVNLSKIEPGPVTADAGRRLLELGTAGGVWSHDHDKPLSPGIGTRRHRFSHGSITSPNGTSGLPEEVMDAVTALNMLKPR